MTVLYEDNHVVAVVKPAGVLAQGDKTGDPNMIDMVRYYLKTTYKKTGNVFVGLVHRLDRNVGGVMLFAKTSKGAARLSEAIRTGNVEKEYHAVVQGALKKSGSLRHYLVRDGATNRTEAFDTPRPSAKEARLQYEIVKESARATLIRIKLETGRSHQIRAQFAAIGHPLLGDIKYGGPELPQHAMALCCTKMVAPKVTGEGSIEARMSYPKEWDLHLV